MATRVATLSKATRTWVLAGTILGSSMVFIDGTVVNIALPVIQSALHATAIDMQWVVNAYTLFLAALMIVGGSLGDHFGRRRMFVTGTVIFALASVWCGFAPNINQLILARGLQGIGSALLTPGSLAIISATFEGKERGHAIGTWSGFTAITAAIGPVLGGVIAQYLSWRWIFFINIPLAIAVVAVSAGIPESRDDEKVHHLDYAGALLATIGLGGLTYGLINAGAVGFGDRAVIAALALGVLALAAFIAVEARARAPMMPLTLFASRTFSGANLLTFLLYAALGGVLFFVPFDLIQVQHYTPTEAGLSLLPFIAFMVLLSRWAGGLVAQYGSKLPLIIGPTIAAVGFALFALPGVGGSYWTTFFPAVFVLGLGMAITVAPLTTTVLEAVDEEHVGLASAINNAVSRAGGLFSVAALSLVVLFVFNMRLDASITALHAPPPLTAHVAAKMAPEREKLAAAQPPQDVPTQIRDELRSAILVAYQSGFRAAMLVGSVLALASAIIAAVLIEGKPRQKVGSSGTKIGP